MSTERRARVVDAVRAGEADAAWVACRAELAGDADAVGWLSGLVSEAMAAPDLAPAGLYAGMLARARWGAEGPVRPEPRYVSVYKLGHDVEQLEHLRDHGAIGAEAGGWIDALRRARNRLVDARIAGRVPLDDTDDAEIGAFYNRLLHVGAGPRLPEGLSPTWDADAVQSRYLDHPPGLVVVDDFLSPGALAGLRTFCLESTVWSANRYGHGRLGAFFRDGFNCPLLLQIAEELRARLPRILGDRFPLRQLWAFKNRHHLPGDSTTHADFAAVNVNFWITPEDANLDPDSGGMIVYEVDAPPDWDFEAYNRRPDLIRPYLRRHGARPIVVPYRSNRAVLFNSDLFHGTQAVTFRPGYVHRRVNVTMLYGDRLQDLHHPTKARAGASSAPVHAWRSAVFRRR